MTKISDREREELEKAKSLPHEYQVAILYNMKHGLLCACNKVRIPYFGREPGTHGTLMRNGMLHGYDDCRVLGRIRTVPEGI